MTAQILFFTGTFSRRPSMWDAEASALEVWHGKNPYSDFLRKHQRRPGCAQASTIGRLMGTRVRADDGSMQPPKRRGKVI